MRVSSDFWKTFEVDKRLFEIRKGGSVLVNLVKQLRVLESAIFDVNDSSWSLKSISFKELLIVATCFAFCLIAFTYQEVFLLDAMYLDDHHRYTLGLNLNVHEYIVSRNWARAYFLLPLYWFLSIDPMWARLAEVLFCMAPLSVVVYFCMRRYGDVTRPVAFFAALLPSALPAQLQIPYFIDGSYTVQGLLVYLCSLIVTLEFANRKEMSKVLMMGAVAIYYLSIEMMDHAIFMIPFTTVVVFFVGGVSNRFKRKVLVLLPLAAIAGYEAWVSLLAGHAPSVLPSWGMFLTRLEGFVHATLPYSYSRFSSPGEVAITGLFFACLLFFSLGVASLRERLLLISGLVWVVVSSVVFVTITEWYQPRYSYIAGFGVNFIIVYSVAIIATRLPIREIFRQRSALILLVLLTTFAEFRRHSNMGEIVDYYQPPFDAISKVLKNYSYPHRSQIVIIVEPYKVVTGGYHWYSTGFMKYASGREDISGQIGMDRNFFNAYGTEKRFFVADHKMSGLDKALPIFFYKLFCPQECELQQRAFTLQWQAENWNLYEYDQKSGVIIAQYTGAGIDDYQARITALGLSQEDVIFGKGSP